MLFLIYDVHTNTSVDKVTFRDFRNISMTQLNENLESVNWDAIDYLASPDEQLLYLHIKISIMFVFLRNP